MKVNGTAVTKFNKSKVRNILLLMMSFLMMVVIVNNEKYQDIKPLISFALIIASMKVVFDYYLGLTMRVGYSGDIKNNQEMKGFRVVLLILGLSIGGVGVWFLQKI